VSADFRAASGHVGPPSRGQGGPLPVPLGGPRRLLTLGRRGTIRDAERQVELPVPHAVDAHPVLPHRGDGIDTAPDDPLAESGGRVECGAGQPAATSSD